MSVAWINGTKGAIRTLDERNLGWPTPSIPIRLPERRTHQRGGFQRWASEEAPGGLGLPKRGAEEGLGRGWHPLGNRASRASTRSEAAHRDRPFKPEEGLRSGRDL